MHSLVTYFSLVLLIALNLPLGKTTVMHLIVREHVPGEASSNGEVSTCFMCSVSSVMLCVVVAGTTERSKDRQEGSTCDCCVIL